MNEGQPADPCGAETKLKTQGARVLMAFFMLRTTGAKKWELSQELSALSLPSSLSKSSPSRFLSSCLLKGPSCDFCPRSGFLESQATFRTYVDFLHHLRLRTRTSSHLLTVEQGSLNLGEGAARDSFKPLRIALNLFLRSYTLIPLSEFGTQIQAIPRPIQVSF